MVLYNNGTRSMYTMYSEDNISDYITIRLPEVRAGQTLEGIFVFYYVASPSNVFSPYEFTVYSEDFNLTQTNHGTFDGSASPLTGTFGLSGNTTDIEIDGDNNKHFYVKINRRTAGSGLPQYITHISYLVRTSTVEGIGGF